VVEVNGGDNSIDSKNTNLDKRAIHIHGGMEHNMVGYAKYYSCGRTKISRSSEFTKETNHNRRNFPGPKFKRYFWQNLKLKKTQNVSKATIDKQVGSLVPEIKTIVVTIYNHTTIIQV